MRLLVTGGAGFIGSHLVDKLSSAAVDEVVVLDNLSFGFSTNIPENVPLLVGDVCNKAFVDSVFAEHQFDAVVHLAAQTMVPYSIKHPSEDCEINLLGLINILEACKNNNVKTFIFSSSAAVYGNNEDIPLKETAALCPTSFYGITKMTSEHYIRVYHELYGLNALVFRFANVYGERQGAGGEGGVVSIFCKLLSANQKLQVFGNGEQTRDFIYAGDIAEAIIAGLKNAQGFKVCNVSSATELSINGLLNTFKKAAGRDFEVEYLPPREGDIFRSVLDNTYLCQVLNAKPTMDIQIGITKTFADYLNHGKESDQ